MSFSRPLKLLLIVLCSIIPVGLTPRPGSPAPPQWGQLLRFLVRSGGTRTVAVGAEQLAVRSALRASSEIAVSEAATMGMISATRQGDKLMIKNLTDGYVSLGAKPQNSGELLSEYLKIHGQFESLSEFQRAYGLIATNNIDDATAKLLDEWVNITNKRILAEASEAPGTYKSLEKLILTTAASKAEVTRAINLSKGSYTATQVEEMQNVLKFNGYLDESVTGQWSSKTENALYSLLADENITSADALKSTMAGKSKELLTGFKSVGFPANDLNAAIKKFQLFRNEPATGKFSAKMVKALKQEMGYALEVKRLSASQKTPWQYLTECKRLTNQKSHIASFQKIDNSFYALVENNTYATPGTEVWRVRNGLIERLDQKTLYSEVINASDAQIKKRVDDPMIVSIFPEKSEGSAHLVTQKGSYSRLEGDILYDIDELDNIFSRKSGKENVIINRNLYDRAIKKIDNEAYALTEFNFNNEDLYHELNRRYGEFYNFFLDDELDVAVNNIGTLPRLTSMSDLKVIFSEKGKIDDDQIIKSLKYNYKQYSDVFDSKMVKVPSSNVILVTGHKSDDLRTFLLNHGKVGNLQGKVIGVFSCYDVSDANFYSDLIRKYGAKEIVYFPYELKSSAVNATLDELMKTMIEETKNGGDGKYLHDLIRKAVERAKQKPGNTLIRSELEKLFYSIKQVSQIATSINKLNPAA